MTNRQIADATNAYYTTHAAQFIDGTINADMGNLYQRFLPFVPEGSHILDLGCGSGRDALAFKKRGYPVTAVEPTEKLAECAERLLEQPVLRQTAQELTLTRPVHAVWANASLLHVPRTEMPTAINRLAGVLVPGGILYMSFKVGHGDRWTDGRFFCDYTATSLRALMPERAFSEIEIWESLDVRPDRPQVWLNALYRRSLAR